MHGDLGLVGIEAIFGGKDEFCFEVLAFVDSFDDIFPGRIIGLADAREASGIGNLAQFCELLYKWGLAAETPRFLVADDFLMDLLFMLVTPLLLRNPLASLASFERVRRRVSLR
jgi:hypothetical protein